MNALLAQFLAEAGELLAAVDDGLLQLERDPKDTARLDEVFRAAHTIKGSSGLFDLPALTALTHAAEDLLDAVRSGDLDLTPDVVDTLLAGFDVLRGWLDDIGATEHLPAGADAAAAELAVRLRAPLGLGGSGTPTVSASPAADAEPAADLPGWVCEIGEARLRALAEWLAATGGQVRAVRYVPDPGCFFCGDDPLHLISQVPAVEALAWTTAEPWGPADDFDEYASLLRFTLLTRADHRELGHLFRYAVDEVEVVEVGAAGLTRLLDGPPPAPPAPERGLATVVRTVLSAQRAALAVEVPAAAAQTRLRAIVHVVVAALSAAGLPADEARAAGESELAGQEGVFLRWLEGHLADVEAGPDRAGVVDAVVTPQRAAQAVGEPRTHVGAKALKVDAATIDNLLELVGELVVAKNALPFLADDAEAAGVRDIARRVKDEYAVLNRIVEELQGRVMDVRMLPVQVAFDRAPRLVRDLARQLGKQVDLVMEGADTAADKDIIEALGDPLVHLLRNSLDHGIELPAQRTAAGKEPCATLTLRARQDGEAVIVELSDDGRGVDIDAVKRRAWERGLLTEVQMAQMPDAEAVQLVFLPGFSTATEVSSVSGRGVGMDVVRVTVESLGGSVTMTSERGVGTVTRLRMPLSMAISRVLLVEVAGQRFGVPVDAVRDTVRVPRGDVKRLLDGQALTLRDAVVPIIDLAQTLGLGSADAGDQVSVLVVDVGGRSVGLVVEAFHRDTEVLLKPLDGVLAGLAGYSGTALLGDGQVLLVLDLEEVLACPST